MAAGKYSDWLTEDGLLRIEGWARDGLTDKQIAENKIGISERTFSRWKDKYPSILSALKNGKRPVDTEVENATLNLAKGYYVTVKKPIKVKTKRQLDGKGTIEEERIEYVDEQIYIPPNVTAQIFWLKNRKPGKWRDRQIDPIKEADVEDLSALAELLNEPDTED